MLNFYISAVKYNYMKIEEVPPQYQEDVRLALGIE